jgi:hypothetical protein
MKSFKNFKKTLKNNVHTVNDDSAMYIHFKMHDNHKHLEHKHLDDNESFIHFKHPHRSFKEDNEHIKDTHLEWLEHNDNSHIGYNNSDVSKYLATAGSRINYIKRDENVRNSIRTYTDDSITLNKKLVSRKPLNTDEEWHVKHLDAVANEPAPEHHHLYSGLGRNRIQKIKEAAKNGNEITLPAYTSLSTSKIIARQFAGHHNYQDEHGNIIPRKDRESHYISLHVKKGQKAGHIANDSEHPDEKESILPRNTRIKIHPTPSIHPDRHGGTHYVWHAEISHQD